jgi:hypothetical protein
MSNPSLKSKKLTLELIHPSEGKCGWVLDVVGVDSKQVRTRMKEIAVDRADSTKMGDESDKVTVQFLTDNQSANAKIVASSIVGWNESFTKVAGEYTVETAEALMLDEEINWIREQVESAIRQRANFFR